MLFTKSRFKKYALATIISFSLACLIILPSLNYAQASLWDMQEGRDILHQPFGQSQSRPADPRAIAIDVVRIFLSFMAIVFIILIIWGGFRWMMSRGNEDEVNKAKSQIKAAIYGMVIVMVSYSITEFVLIFMRRQLFNELGS
jgi:hypothetical protein